MNKRSLFGLFLAVFMVFLAPLQVAAWPRIYGETIPQFTDSAYEGMPKIDNQAQGSQSVEPGTWDALAVDKAINNGIFGGLKRTWESWFKKDLKASATDVLNAQHEPVKKLISNGIYDGVQKSIPLLVAGSLVGIVGTAGAMATLFCGYKYCTTNKKRAAQKWKQCGKISATVTGGAIALATVASIACARQSL